MRTPLPSEPGDVGDGGELERGRRVRLREWAGAFARSTTLTRLLLAYFVLQASFLALVTAVGIPPDERFHVESIRFHAARGLSPLVHVQQDFFHLGDLVRTPSYLYHYLLSFGYRLSPFSHDNTVAALRLVNVAMVLGALWFLVLFMRRLRFPGAVVNLSLLVITNTMMLVFLAGSVNYDNQLLLLSSIAFFLFIRLVDEFTVRESVLLMVTMLALLLTKVAALPLVVLFAVALLFVHRKAIPTIPSLVRLEWERSRLVLAGLLVLLLVPLALVGERYGGNLLQYGSVMVACDAVHAVEDCEKSAIFVRDREFLEAAPPVEQRSSLVAFSLGWVDLMRERAFGIFGQNRAAPPALVQLGSMGLLLLLPLGVARGLTRNRALNASLLIGILYVATLLGVNRRTYMRTGIFGLALQGRYAFPVMLVLVSGGLYYTWRATSDSPRMRAAIVGFLIVTFIGAGAPAFLYATDPGWYGGRLAPLATALHEAIRALLPRVPHL